ncbi:hypothetical protein PHMEG_000655 [Phytophthora megakarya]|uniref:Uncharacterized protein n=1 Tax=Phytophthora megakarya TaxID=4795 RepID=A0A225X2H9_9STRA|nr:hypothetical protein PHMEG_000655 [Phytophthora megakarya]
MGSKKRRRSESFQAEQGGDGDARKRLAAFHARMFDLPQEETVVRTSETPRVLFKAKKKKKLRDVDDGEAVPAVKFNKMKPKKGKKKEKKVAAVKMEKVTGPAVVTVPGMVMKSKKEKIKKVKKVKSAAPAVQAVKTTQVQVSASAPQWHSMQMEEGGEDGVDPLEQALGSMKEIATRQVEKPSRKKHKTVTDKAADAPTTKKLKKKREEPVKAEIAASNGLSVVKTAPANGTTTITSKKTNMPTKKGKSSIKARKVVPSEEETQSLKPLTPIGTSLVNDAKKKNDMFLPVRETPLRLFASEWSFNESRTARFLLDTCPELVSVDFLEGLGVNLSAKQLVQVFEAGSGNSGVLMNKMASAVENGHLSVRDPSFVSALERRVALMETNDEVMELLHPLLESLSSVRDVGCLLKQLCEHWQLQRRLALVQRVLLSNVFDDLDGNQDEILLDLPDLTGRLDFPSRLDQEDVDENGNLKGFLANDDSDFSGEEGSGDDEMDDEDSENDDNPYEGETDSEDEVEITGRNRGRNQFIEDEADVGEEEEEDEEEEHHEDPSSSSDSD